MDYIVVCLVALLVSALTFIAGFGLGTMLMPAFAVFFPLPVAIAATAVVHLFNNIFKVGLIGLKADWSVVIKFAVPGFIMSILGAYLLNAMDQTSPIMTYILWDQTCEITLIKVIIGLLIIIFALFDLLPVLSRLSIPRKFVGLGGAISGFFGGLSGHQGALRTTFLIKFGLEKEVFIATGIVAAVIIDVGRLIVYGVSFYGRRFDLLEGQHLLGLVTAASIAAFAGAVAGRFLLKKITFRTIQITVGILLILLGGSLLTGLL